MFQGWRFQLREAEAAADQGQLDEACSMLTQANLRRYLPGKRLSAKVASELAQRARSRVIQGDLSAGWRDLQTAKSLAGEIGPVLNARQEIIELTLGEAESQIENGDPGRAIQLLEKLERLEVEDEPVRWMKEIARRLESARNLALRGRFSDAQSQAEAADRIHPKYGFAAEVAQNYRDKVEPFRRKIEALHRSMTEKQWTEVARLADEALEMAPDNQLGREARKQAWAHVGTQLSDSRGQMAAQRPLQATVRGGTEELATAVASGIGSRFLLWIDGVGGFLVCLDDEVVLGQASSEATVAIPIQADLSRQHAKICRQGDGYIIEPLQATRVNGQPVVGPTLLSDGDELELAGAVRLRFRQPHALSASARIDLLSRHPTQPKADSILLMAESCVLGPKLQNHVICRDWQGDVVLYRRDGELFCRAMDSLEIDGQHFDGRGQLTANSHVSGSDFSISLEELS